MEHTHPDRTALIERVNLDKSLEGGVSNTVPATDVHAEPAKTQGGTIEQIPSLEQSDSVVIFHPESSEVITVDGTDQKDERKRDRERRRPSGRDRDRDDRSRDRVRDRGPRRENWDKSSGSRTSRRDRDRGKYGDSNASRRENWDEFQKRQRIRQVENKNFKRPKDPNRDTSLDYIVPQNYLYDDRSMQDYETTKKRNTRIGGGGNRNSSPDHWRHDRYDPNERPEEGDPSVDRWALAD